MHVLLVTSFLVLVRNLSAKCKWQDALCEGVNGLWRCGGRGVPWGDGAAGDRPRVRLHPGLVTKKVVRERKEKGKAEVSSVMLVWIVQNGFVSPLWN